jgi:hypothetical protein
MLWPRRQPCADIPVHHDRLNSRLPNLSALNLLPYGPIESHPTLPAVHSPLHSPHRRRPPAKIHTPFPGVERVCSSSQRNPWMQVRCGQV